MFDDLNKDIAHMKASWQFGQWVVKTWRKRAERKRLEREIGHTRQTGLPPPETELGRKAREAMEAQERKLVTPPPIHGSARWATVTDAAALVGRKPGRELLLGYLMDGDGDTGTPIVARYPGHLLTVAGTGQGKSATQIVANLMTYTGSVVVIDPKGELYDLTASCRRQLGKVYRLAPLAREGEHTDRYNPLDELGPLRERGQRARALAEMLVVRQGLKGAAAASFWENEAINLLTTVILLVLDQTEAPEDRDNRTLAEVRHLLSLPLLGDRSERDPNTHYFEDTLRAAAAECSSPRLAEQCLSFANYEPKLLSGFISELNSNLAFFDGHDGFADVTSRSDFRFSDLASESVTVYLTIPLKHMATSFRFLRAMVGQAFAALEEQREAQEASVLFILDEFPAMRDMDFMRDAVAQMRSAGAWFWFFVQDVAQLEAVYGRASSVFLSQTDYQVFFGAVNDPNTKKHVSTTLGVSTFAYRDPSVSWSHSIGANTGEPDSPWSATANDGKNLGQGVNVNNPVMLAPVPLLTPFDVGTFLGTCRQGETHPSTAIVFAKSAGGYPIKIRRMHWRALVNAMPGLLPASEGATAPARPVRR